MACDGERIVGALTAVLRHTLVDGERVLAAKLEDMKTDPAYRGRGVMSRTFKRVKEEALDRGAHFLMGGPTSPLSYPIFVKRLGFSAPFGIRNVVRPLRARVLGRALPLTLPGRNEHRSVGANTAAPAGFAELAERATQVAQVATWRSAAYLNWRYDQHPDTYRFVSLREGTHLQGVAVVKETWQRDFHLVNVVDLIAPEGHTVRRVLAAVGAYAAGSASADFVVAWPPRGRGLLAHLARGLPAAARADALCALGGWAPHRAPTCGPAPPDVVVAWYGRFL